MNGLRLVGRGLASGALALARGRLGRLLIGRLFASASFALPVRRLRETQTLVAFHHPRPAYPLHILIVPKKALGGLGELGAADAAFMLDLFQAVQSLVGEFGLEEKGYRLIANGGKYQEVGQLHFHLVADIPPHPPAPSPTGGEGERER